MATRLIGRAWTLPTESQPVRTNALGQIVSLTSAQTEIRQSIGIILMTMPGERVMRPNFGCRIHELIFAPNNRETAVQAQRYVTTALQRWEPRITVNQVVAQPAANATDAYRLNGANRDAALLVSINYTINATGETDSLAYPFYLMPDEA